ncbi:MAG: hypothetical protein M1133_09995 [Armatimonadetes bacterium]|nr:hypothetical protein [Armatimonadota bacterium]
MKGIYVKVFLAALTLCLAAPVIAQTAAPAPPPVELHGYMLNRMYANPDSSARFAIQRVSLSAQGNLPGDKIGYVEVYFHPWVTDAVLPASAGANNTQFTGEQGRTYLESAYLDMPLGSGRLRIGKGRQLNFGLTPTYPNRKTTQYYTLSQTFTQERIQGFQYAYKKGIFDAGASLFTDLRIGNTKIGGDLPNAEATKTVRHFVNKDDSANNSGRMAGAIKLGVSTPCLKAHLSGMVGSLQQVDANFIAAQYGATASTIKRHNAFGADAMFSKNQFVASGEWYTGDFSFLKITGYSVMAGFEPKDKTSRRYYVRYSALNNDQAPTSNQYTWNTQQLMFGVVQPISKGVWIEANYEKNTEDPGGGAASINDDVFLVEFFTGF